MRKTKFSEERNHRRAIAADRADRVLLDFSDREVMHELALTEDSMKKRGRSIYRAAVRVEPGLSARRTGADLRRAPLQRQRHHLVELCPYK